MSSFRNAAPQGHKGFAAIHGHSGSQVYYVWIAMKQRCLNPNNKDFQYYGGRGITVCERWQKSFEDFLSDMGPRPNAMTVERRDNDGPYAPANCYWASRRQQSSNKRFKSELLNVNGDRRLSVEWAKDKKIPAYLIRHRLRCGWSVERAVLTPPRYLKHGERYA